MPERIGFESAPAGGTGPPRVVRSLGTLIAPTSGSAIVAGIPLSPKSLREPGDDDLLDYASAGGPGESTKVYPGFYTFERMPGVGGPGYGLDLYTSPTTQAHFNEVAGIYGKAGDSYAVSTHTIPVHLGTSGWAYIDPNPGTNAGYTITVVHSFALGVTAEDYTYTIDRTCPIIGQRGRPRFACLEHVARSLVRYTASSLH